MASNNINQNKVPRRSILSSLYDREINGMKRPMNCIRSTYQNIHPNCTVVNVKKPPCHPRKFTPDGRNLIAFSDDLTYIEVYDYLGCASAGDMLVNYEGNCISQIDSDVQQQIFQRLFKLKYRIKVTSEREKLNKAFCLLTNNGYAVVASAKLVSDDHNPRFFDVYTNNEAIAFNPLFPLENYTIYLVNINCGTISHSIRFKCDKIYLSHSHGVYLLKNTLAILSVQHQIIHVYVINQNHLCFVKKIGRFCFEDDHLLIASVYTTMNNSMYRTFREKTINGLKHKLMIFLYKKAEREARETGSQSPIQHFYQYFKQYLSLRMWKMQLLGDNHVIIGYTSEDVIALKTYEPSTQVGMFMIYDMDSNKVLEVFENTSSELLEIFERYSDNFHLPHENLEGLLPSSPRTNIHGCVIEEANRRILARLTKADLTSTCSPYLNKSLYIYDEDLVSSIDRPMLISNQPVRFYARDSGNVMFSLYTRNSEVALNHTLRIVAFIFHPTDPFALSLHVENFDYFINFHLRKVYLPE